MTNLILGFIPIHLYLFTQPAFSGFFYLKINLTLSHIGKLVLKFSINQVYSQNQNAGKHVVLRYVPEVYVVKSLVE